MRVSVQTAEGPYFNGGSTSTGVPASKPPAYPTHPMPGRSTTVIVTAAVYRGFNSMLPLR